MRKTKIICTLGPAADNEAMITALAENGMNVARLNFSHGDYEEHKRRIDLVKKVRAKLKKPIGIMLDTKGPEIRIREFACDAVEMKEGAEFTLTTRDVEGDETIVSVTYKDLPKELKAGDMVLIDDGLVGLKVKKIKGQDILCDVMNSGTLSGKKSINLPGISVSMPYLSDKDQKDILFGIENNVDFIAASFTRTASDILEIKKILAKNNGTDIQVIAKIENMEGVNNIEDIIRESDGIMVARGDMGVEIPMEELPAIQKMLIKKCYLAGKKVITATQMLDSMIRNPRPTRAETTDVANAVYDGTSALMLSGETAVGKYPVESVQTMAKIALSTEQSIDYKKIFEEVHIDFETNVTNAISHATCMTAHDLGAVAILTVSRSGHTARMVSKYRPACPIICGTPIEKVYCQLSMSWGVTPIMSEEKYTTDDLFDHVTELAKENGYVSDGDIVVITGGVPVGVSGTTNILKVHLVGNILVQGTGIGKSGAVGNICVADTEEEALKLFENGDILVISSTSNNLLPIIKNAKGIIVEEEGTACHAAIVGLALDIPVITGAKGAVKLLRSGSTITMDCQRGLVISGAASML